MAVPMNLLAVIYANNSPKFECSAHYQLQNLMGISIQEYPHPYSHFVYYYKYLLGSSGVWLQISVCHIFNLSIGLYYWINLQPLAWTTCSVLKWFHSYLTEHQQSVLVDEEPSNNLPVMSGVPQGVCFLSTSFL